MSNPQINALSDQGNQLLQKKNSGSFQNIIKQGSFDKRSKLKAVLGGQLNGLSLKPVTAQIDYQAVLRHSLLNFNPSNSYIAKKVEDLRQTASRKKNVINKQHSIDMQFRYRQQALSQSNYLVKVYSDIEQCHQQEKLVADFQFPVGVQKLFELE